MTHWLTIIFFGVLALNLLGVGHQILNIIGGICGLVLVVLMLI